ncbi:MAG: hypothetical protein GY714_05750 [Desulfobacterales bacterium]|nr:hypothetical protein [Desulfobacterales bacterium]MCP4160457.1 hypothetical protein [Deltaproteobacteria bacterium]
MEQANHIVTVDSSFVKYAEECVRKANNGHIVTVTESKESNRDSKKRK